MRGRDGAWVGWAGEAGEAPEPFVEDGMYLRPGARCPRTRSRDYYEGFCNDTLWPLYHDVIVPATFHRDWWDAYEAVNQRFAEAVGEVAAEGATVWVHDYQLQLVPAMVRELRPDLRIGFFNHIPFPPVELFAQLPWRAQIARGPARRRLRRLPARRPTPQNFVRACRQLLGLPTKRDTVVGVALRGRPSRPGERRSRSPSTSPGSRSWPRSPRRQARAARDPRQRSATPRC